MSSGKKTLRLAADASALDAPPCREALAVAAEILRRGGTVAFPTETVYGLGANALNASAVEAIFRAKQRPSWDPVIVHIAARDQLAQVAASIPPKCLPLLDAFWPGPLTLLLPRGEAVPSIVTAGRPRVGVRMPAHPVALRLIALAGVPVAAPSANTFGRTSPTRARFVLDDLDGRIDAIVECDPPEEGDAKTRIYGLESTVLDICEDPPVLYRPGAVSREELESVCGPVQVFQSAAREDAHPASLPSPGVGIRHYAPRARLVLVEDQARLAAEWAASQAAGERTGLMLPEEWLPPAGAQTAGLIYRWGRWAHPEELARGLFAGLRELDAGGATAILCPLPLPEGIGAAIRDRLWKAARKP